ncbi:Vps16, N-terminal region-domain-containing protein [Phlyctochytrium arcticum]|nr:Vps16, N-terminal region-domain-containing protein [Phlyctochytrium arcticum]
MLVGSLSPAAEWNLLHDRFYCKQETYSMLWKGMELSKFIIAVASFGGPIAMIRDDKKILSLQSQTVKPVMHLYTASGKLLNQFQWDKGRIVEMGWTNTEHLMCVLETGVVRIYDIHGEFNQFSLGQDAKDSGVLQCRLWESGLVVLTGNYKLIAVTDLAEPRPSHLADPGLTSEPSAWTVIAPELSLSRHLEVVLAINSTVLVVDSSSAQDQLLTQGPFTSASVSPNGKFLALFTEEGRLWVVSTDFQKNLAEFATNSSTPPLQMTWCGTDSVVLHWPDSVLMVGPFGDWIKYTYEGIVRLVPEIDGLRIISNEKCEFLQRVPTSMEEVFKIGSTAPGAILFDAFDHFEKKSPRADENIRSIRSELTEAVDSCLDAAGHEIHPTRQRALLRAASFGKCFLDSYNSDRFVKVCEIIRVLNAVRHYEVGIPLTYTQFLRLTPEVLINRLINRHHHLLALRISEYLRLNGDRVLVHWACAKIRVSVDDEETLCRIIVEKLGGRDSGISYTDVAKTAFETGQTRLATKLLDYEPQAANQVPLLMSMQEDELAMAKAVESGDTDLVYLVILHLRRKLPPADFFRIINDKPLACSLLERYAMQQDRQLLRDFYYQDDRRFNMAHLELAEAFETSDIVERTRHLKIASKLLAEDKSHAFETKMTEEQIKLLALQPQLERDTGQSFADLSLTESISKLLVVGNASRAAKLKSDFKVPDRR